MNLKHLFFILLVSSAVTSPSFAVPVRLELNPLQPGIFTQIELPFQYHPVRSDEKFTLVFQNTMAFLKPDSEEDYLILTPLRPCLGIVFFNQKNHHQIAFHKHWSNDPRSLAEYYPLLEVSDPRDITVKIFSTAMDETTYKNDFQSTHENRSHRQEIIQIRNQIIRNFNIPQGQVTVTLWDSPYQETDFRIYSMADVTLLIDKQGKFYSVSPIAENLMRFDDFSILKKKPNKLFATAMKYFKVNLFELMEQEFQSQRPWNLTKGNPYGRLPFVRVDSSSFY